MKEKNLTYTSFLNKSVGYSVALDMNISGEIIEHFRPTNILLGPFTPVTFIVDYISKKYIYVEASCFDLLGFTASYFLETGLEEYLSRWHPVDFQLMDTKVFPANLAFLKGIHKSQYSNYIFSYNYRFQNATGEYINLLQRFSFVANPDGTLPRGVVGVVFDISHFKSDATIIHTIEGCKKAENGGKVMELLVKNIYPIFDGLKHALFSKREKQIINLIARGFSSKQIAAHTQLSIYTVHNHRKNILAKAEVKSSSELISYAAKHGLI